VGQCGRPNIGVSRLLRTIMAVDLYDRFRHANDWAPERAILVDFSSAQPHYFLSLHHPLIPLFPYFLCSLYFRHLSSDRLAL
jgi:hypothetical protein